MKPNLPAICLLAMISFSSGCTTFWYQEEKSFNQCKDDMYYCRYKMQERSDKSMNLGFYDTKFNELCMQQRGYRLVHEDQLPLCARRQGPGYYLSSRQHGAAGTIE